MRGWCAASPLLVGGGPLGSSWGLPAQQMALWELSWSNTLPWHADHSHPSPQFLTAWVGFFLVEAPGGLTQPWLLP